MSTQGETLHHPINGSAEQTWDGFSWPGFLFGIFWLLAKGLYGHFVINLLAIVLTLGYAAPIVWIAYGILGNGIHRDSLIKKGYLTGKQWNERNPKRQDELVSRTLARESAEAAAAQAARMPSASLPHSSVADELRKLAELCKDGVLTEEEFAQQKAALLTRGTLSGSSTKSVPSSDDVGRSNAELMAKYGITFDGNAYRYTTCRFSSPSEAIKYAQSMA